MIDSRHTAYLDDCCEALGVQLHEVLGKDKDKEAKRAVQARKAIAWAIRDRHPGLSWSDIGELLKRDHSTMMYSAAVFRRAVAAGAEWAVEMRALLTGRAAPLPGLETALDSLRSCAGIDLAGAVELKEVG